jgi:CHASE2 domain-containing sensor protein
MVTMRDCVRFIIEWCVVMLVSGFIAILTWSSHMVLALKIPVTSVTIIASAIAAIMFFGIFDPTVSKISSNIDIKG